ncbi:MAG TPA: SDR family oxidoreductase [Solirubrobacteraceae bacterium]|jgi:short-subunit dehydrogenase|nr:SDR family oxidoreductase [Solirubrobacteraceae bacterium]
MTPPAAEEPEAAVFSQDAQSTTTAALVTGASSGIGVALAGELARRGHGLILVARRADRLREMAAEIGGEHGVRVEWIDVDLTDAAARDRIAAEVAARGLVVDVLVNDAGMGTSGRFHELPIEQEIRMVRLNVEAMVALCGAFVPGMVERGSGRVLNVASVSGFMPVPQQATYSASKAFVLTFTEALTIDLHGTGVTATALCPGPVKTEFEGIIDGLPSGLFLEPARVAREAIDALEQGRLSIVPGAMNKVNAVSGRYAPRRVFLPLARRFWPTGSAK